MSGFRAADHRRRLGGGRDDGVTTVEFALVLPVTLLILGFLAAAGLYSFWSAMAGDVARDTVRHVSISTDGHSYPDASAKAYAAGRLGGAMGSTLTSVSVTGAAQEGQQVTVSLTYHVPGISALTSLVDVIPGLDISALDQVTRTATARRE